MILHTKITSETAAANTTLVLLPVKNMFIFNKSSKEVLHILMGGIILQHCMFILLRQILPIFLCHLPQGCWCTHTHCNPEAWEPCLVPCGSKLGLGDCIKSAFSEEKWAPGTTLHSSYTEVAREQVFRRQHTQFCCVFPKTVIHFFLNPGCSLMITEAFPSLPQPVWFSSFHNTRSVSLSLLATSPFTPCSQIPFPDSSYFPCSRSSLRLSNLLWLFPVPFSLCLLLLWKGTASPHFLISLHHSSRPHLM